MATPNYYLKQHTHNGNTYTVQPNDVINFFNMRHYSANALEYVWRAGLKTDCPMEDMTKAVHNLQFAIEANEPAPRSKGYNPKFVMFISSVNPEFMDHGRFMICKAIMNGQYKLALNLIEDQGITL